LGDASTADLACAANLTGDVVEVTTNPLPIATISGGDEICAGEADPTVQVSVVGSVGPWNITYTDGTNTYTENGLTGTFNVPNTGDGTYEVLTVVDAVTLCAGNVFGTAVVVTHPLPLVDVLGGGTICDGEPRPDVVFDFTEGTGPFDVTYLVDGNSFSIS